MSLFRHLNVKKGSKPSVFYTFDLEMCFAPQRRALFRHLSGPRMVCFVHFDLEMCFAPQRRALFRHLNFQKWSETGVFCAFWLWNVLRLLRATTACTFSSLIWPDGSAPAASASLLFDPPEPQIIGKTQCFATFLPFRASASSFFWLFLFYHLLSSALLSSAPLSSTFLFSLTLSISAFHLSILSEVWLLNFLRWWNETAEVFKVLYPSLPLPGLPVEGGRNMLERVVFSRFVCNKEDRIVCSLQQWEWVVAG